MRILVIEDEPGVRNGLREHLVQQEFTVVPAADGKEGLFWASELDFDAAIVDLGLPDISGLEVIRQLRQRRTGFPILVLTARDRWQDKVEGLEAGADDYVSKPFRFEEVLARLRALVRRASGWTSPELAAGPIVLNVRQKTLRVAGNPVDLTNFEYRLLEHLMLHAGCAVSKDELAERLYDEEIERSSNIIEVYMTRLRKKLDPRGEFKPFKTFQGRGYVFDIPASSQQPGAEGTTWRG